MTLGYCEAVAPISHRIESCEIESIYYHTFKVSKEKKGRAKKINSQDSQMVTHFRSKRVASWALICRVTCAACRF